MTQIDGKGIDVEFELTKEGADKITYRETYPRGVVGSFYVTRIGVIFKWGRVPERVKIRIEPME